MARAKQGCKASALGYQGARQEEATLMVQMPQKSFETSRDGSAAADGQTRGGPLSLLHEGRLHLMRLCVGAAVAC